MSAPPTPLHPDVEPVPVADPETAAAAPVSRRRRGRGRRTAAGWLRAHATGVAIATAACVVGAVIVFAWFRTGTFYGRGDVAPWIRDSLRGELGWQWTHQDSGAGGPAYDIVRVSDLIFIQIARLLGGTEALAQRLLFATAFAYAAVGTAMFVSRFTRRAALVFAAGLLGAFNPLVMVNLPNYLLPVAIGAVGTTGAIAVTAARGRATRRHPRLLALLSLTWVSLAINPPLLAIVGCWAALLPVTAPALTGTGRRGAVRVVALLGRSAIWAVPLALWWIVPYAFALERASGAGTIGANTDVASWAWTHAHGSLDRVLTLVAKWSWPDERFGNNVPSMAGTGWRALTFALPAAAFLAAAIARPRRLRTARRLLIALIPLAIVGKGLQPPLPGLNKWLYGHVPGFWLFREPANKFGVLLALALVTGWALALDGGFSRLRVVRRRGHPRGLLLGHLPLALLAVAPLVFAWPMLTGRAVRSADRVRVPGAWHEVARAVNGSSVRGKLLVLPLDDFYQVPTTWGFYGADTMVRQLFSRPVISRNPQSYVGASGEFDALMRATERALNGGDTAAVKRVLRSLGVSHVVVRHDIDFASTIRTPKMSRPEPLEAAMTEVPGFARTLRTDVADVFESDHDADAVEAFSGTVVAATSGSDALAGIVASTPGHLAVAPKGSPLARGTALYIDGETPIPRASGAAGEWHYQRRAGGKQLVAVRPDASGVAIDDTTRISIDGRGVAGRPTLTVPSAGPAAAVDVDGQLLDLARGAQYARVGPGTVIRPYEASLGTALGAWGEVGDCNRYDGRSLQEVGIGVEGGFAGETGVTKLRARAHSACIAAPIEGVTAGDLMQVSVDVHAVEGAPPRTCLWESGPDRCTRLDEIQTLGDAWYRLGTLHRVAAGTTGVRLYLYADQPAPEDAATTGTEAWYRRPRAEVLVPGKPVKLGHRPGAAGTVSIGTGPVETEFDVDSPALVIGGRSEARDCHRYDDRSLDEAGISATDLPGDPPGVRLRARHHSACVVMPVLGVKPPSSYELSFVATVDGSAPPRVCLWEDPTGRCADFETVSSPERKGSGTYRLRGRFDPSTTGVQLYLYADADEGAARIDYRSLALRPVTDEAVVLLPADLASAPVPRLRWSQDNPARYRVHVEGSDAPFVLALTEASSPGWRVRGLSAGAQARPLEVDGYRSGWVIEAPRDQDLVIEYAPARRARAALRVSQAAAVLFVLTLPATPLARRFTGRRSRRGRGRGRRS